MGEIGDYKALKELLIRRIPPKRFFHDVLEGRIELRASGWTDMFCPFHNPQWRERRGKSPSFSIHAEGAWVCHSPACSVHGKNIVNFYEQYHQIDFRKAMRQMYRKWIQPTIPARRIDEWHAILLDTPSILKYIVHKRGLSMRSIKRFRLGFDGDRIIIPIQDRFGFFVDARRYDPTGKKGAKIVSYKEGYGGARIFPVDNLISTTAKGSRVILCEGEWDCMVAIERGYRAVTSTGGAGSWPDDPEEGVDLFRGKVVRIIYDVNDVDSKGRPTNAGQVAARKVADVLGPVAANVKIIQLPTKKKGGDITDFFVHEGRSKAELDAVIDAAPVYARGQKQPNAVAATTHHETLRIRLDEAADSKYYFRPIEMDCLVSGKDLSPYLVPKVVKVTVTDPETGDESTETQTLDTKMNKNILRLVNCTHGQLKVALSDIMNLPKEGVKFETVETFNMEELHVIPAIDLRDLEGKYAIRRAVYMGHGLESNRTYRMTGYTLPDPDTQSSVHVITKADAVHDAVENFDADDDLVARLREKFNPPDGDVRGHFTRIAGWLARNVTKIKQRPDLHTAVDLIFHSVLSFNFNEEEVTKGWLEGLIIGDTRCGKGYVAERLSRFYRLGETVTGENCSFAGLIGGLQKNNDHWFVTWGKVPLNDKRLVIIDEASNLTMEMIGQMSRVRSEGVAEIVKIMSERTRARTRLVWLSNPRSGRPINTYNTGVEAVSELMGNTEDVARLDFAMTVATSEVPSRVINAPPEDKGDSGEFEPGDFTSLIMWAWSRKPDQIQFSERATRLILDTAVRMGRKYSPVIPLVQAENIRVKLAKIAAAVAVRCFSTDETGQKLIVKNQHVRFAHEFLEGIYSKQSMGYDVYSSTAANRSQIPSEDTVIKSIKGLKEYASDFVEGMLEHTAITAADVADFTNQDRFEAQNLVGKLVRLRCLSKEGETYIKRPGFTNLLRAMRHELNREMA